MFKCLALPCGYIAQLRISIVKWAFTDNVILGQKCISQIRERFTASTVCNHHHVSNATVISYRKNKPKLLCDP